MNELKDYRKFMSKEELHKNLNALIGLLEGVTVDNVVNCLEADEVKNWFDLHKHLLNVHPFSEILPAIERALDDGVVDLEEANDIVWLCKRFTEENENRLYFDHVTSAMQQLQGMLYGIMSDGVLNDKELTELSEWLDDNDYLSGTYPFDEVYSLLLAAQQDGVVSDDERNMLRAFFSNFVDLSTSYNIHAPEMDDLRRKYSVSGICAACPEITFEHKLFCFTGISKRAKRADIAELICSKGGSFNNSVTNSTDYLIVGADGNPCWAFSCYGRKVEKAMDLRKHGGKVIVVHENDFWDEV